MKECPKCKEVRSFNDFKDPSLISGYGRFCKYCKPEIKLRKTIKKTKVKKIEISNYKICPRCGSGMVLRKGSYGKFYGCSRFPACRGTRQYYEY